MTGSFDTYLRIEDEMKKHLLFNDDLEPPSKLSSRLIITPRATQKYRLIVTSYKPGEVGKYSLQIRAAAARGKPNVVKDN